MPFSKALDKTAARMESLLSKYLTVGNLVHQLSIQRDQMTPQEQGAATLYRKAKRNHNDGYERSHLRKYLREEISAIFEHQRSLGSAVASAVVPDNKASIEWVVIGSVRQPTTRSFEDQVIALFDEQYPPIVSEQLKQLVGTCALEEGEPRAPRDSFSAERSRWLQTLNRLKVRVHGDPRGERFLDVPERAALANLAYLKTDVKYSDLRDTLCERVGWPRDWRLASFAPLIYRSVAAPQSDQISVIQSDGEKVKLLDAVLIHISKSDRKTRKVAAIDFKEWLEGEAGKTQLTFAGLRTRLKLTPEQRFSMLRKRQTLVVPETEIDQILPLGVHPDEPFRRGFFVKLRTPSAKLPINLPREAMATLKQWVVSGGDKTLADLRASVTSESWPIGRWQFMIEEKLLIEPSIEQEMNAKIDMSYSDAQAVEAETRFDRLPGWHKLKRSLEPVDSTLWNDLQSAWQASNSEEGEKSGQRIDHIFDALTLNFTDREIETDLSKLQPPLEPATIAALRDIVSSGFSHLSYLALRTIRPKLEEGHIYSEACRLSPRGYDHSGSRSRREAKKFLPKLEQFLFRRISVKTNEAKKKHLGGGKYVEVVEKRYKNLANPVVARSFNQARNVLNALIQEYGSPEHVAIELARDMSKPGEIRKKIDRENIERAKQKEKDREAFSRTYGVQDPSDALMRKVRMRNEQDCKCMYSEGEIDLNRLLRDEKYVEVDHILPKSRTNDNNLDNQVLVLTGENQRKGNRTPFEWRGKSDLDWWHSFKVRVLSLPLMSDRKKRKLLLEELDEAEFTAANLVDTRYVTRLFARAIREGLVFRGGEHALDETISPDDTGRIKLDRFMRARVRTPQGGVTAMLRGLWGLSKNRESGDLHHAVDACVIAAATPRLIQRLNQFNRFKEEVIITPDGTTVWRHETLERAEGEILAEAEVSAFVDREFPQPFHPQMFHQEVMARLSRDGRTYLTRRGEHLHYDFANYSETERESIRPVTVSRLVQRYRRMNELHDANPKALRQVSIPLEQLTPEILQLDRYPKQFSRQHCLLFSALAAQLARHEGDQQAAFAGGYVHEGFDAPIQAVRIPWLYLTEEEQKNQSQRAGVKAKDVKGSFKSLPLTKLTLELLNKDTLGEDIWRRDQVLITALREQLNKPGAKASEIFANGFPKPISKKESERRARQGVTDFKPPLVKSIRVPDRAESGFIVRGGIVGQGAATSVLVARNLTTHQLEFIPRYAARAPKARGIYRVGLPSEELLQDQIALFELLPNNFVAIQHPNVIHCFAETRRRRDVDGRVLIDVEPLFPNGIFRGYYKYYEPSNARPVLELHDRSPFFLLADGCTVALSPQVLVERSKIITRKNAAASQEATSIEYVLLEDKDAQKPRTFDLTTTIKRKISDINHFARVPINNLGRTGV
ncbi:MAG: type II CRISPR RNA-guided endonuclease Cas9 [Burkholderiales bacterium]|nr:type II CRISPR RNA-guided endonuclease Cas9 [Burkholderiales bacterium]